MKNTTDLILLSGFLGAGKTTVLKSLLQELEDKKIGVIVNEFGGISIDGEILQKDGMQMIEINNGSIFCSCLKGQFVKTLIDFSEQEFDVVIVENSGMADPSNIGSLLQELAEKVKRKYVYRGSVCLVDAVSFLKYLKILSPIQNQVAASQLILINKVDLVNQSTIVSIRETIKEINPSAVVYETLFGNISLDILERKLTNSGYLGETSNQPWNRPATYSVESQGVFEKEALIQFIEKMEPYAYRIKGFAKSTDGWWQIDVVGDLISVEQVELHKKSILKCTKIVLIGKNQQEYLDALKQNWNSSLHCEMNIYEEKKGENKNECKTTSIGCNEM